MIPLAIPNLAGNEQRYIMQCLETNFVSSVGPFVGRFEKEFAQHIGARYAVACASGTSALHVCLRLMGVEPGDEVMASTFTFIATVNPIRYLGATPVLVDAESDTWCIDPHLVAGELRRRAGSGERLPRAVVAVHVLGNPCHMEPMVEVCEELGIPLLEDAAGALGAQYTAGQFAGKHVGTIGRAGCFSFNGNKIITTGGGGMIVTDDEAFARKAKHLTTQARPDPAEYVHDEVGYNYRLTNIAAALGVAQLELLDQFLAAKKHIADRYDEQLGGLDGVALAPRASWAAPSHWMYAFLLDPARAKKDRHQMQQELQTLGIMARPLWWPIHDQALYSGSPHLGGEVAESLHRTALTLPCSTGLTEDEQEQVIQAVLERLR